MSFDTTVCLKSLCASFYQFMHLQNEETSKDLEREIDVLIAITSHGASVEGFSPTKLLHAETLTVLVSILNESSLKTSLYLKAMVLLFHLASDHDTKESLHHTFKVVSTLATFLVNSCSPAFEQLSMQCLQLLQRITYSNKISCPVGQLETLVDYLIAKIQAPESELTLPSLGVLANLAKHSERVQNYIKSLENIRRVYRSLFTFMSHSNWTVIVFSLMIITSLALHDTVGEKVFNGKNIGQTFQLLFNIIINENQLLTKRYAVDLFIDLLKEEKFRNYLASYHNFQGYIQQVFLLVDCEDKESTSKVLDLLLCITKIPELRQDIYNAIRSNVFEDDETQPPDDNTGLSLQPLLRLAALDGDTGLVGIIDKSLDIIIELIKEMLLQDNSEVSYFPLESCLKVLNEHLLITDEEEMTDTPLYTRASVMAKSLRSLLLLSRNDRTRKLILNVLDVNNIFNLVRKLSIECAAELRQEKRDDTSKSTDIASVFVYGCVVLKSVCERTPNGKTKWRNTLSAIDYSPFLANGLCSTDKELVTQSLNLLFDLYSLETFARDSICHLLALQNARTNGILKSLQQRNLEESGLPCLNKPSPFVPKEPAPFHTRPKTDTLVNQLAEKVKNGLEIKDSKVSEIMEIYEHKLLSSETNETHLQDLLEAKSLALHQADRLLAQYRCRQAQSDAECLKLRSILNETERKCELQSGEIAAQKEENRNYSEQIAILQNEVANLTIVESEHKELKIRYQETTQKLNQQLIELEKEKQNVTMKLHDKEQACSELRKTLSLKETELKEKGQENDQLLRNLEDVRSKSNHEKSELNAKISRLEILCQQRESELRDKEKRILHLQSELDKHAQIAAMIHNLSSGKIPVNKLDFKS